MANLEIKKYPNKILRKKARAVSKIGDEEISLAKDMIDIMHYAKGIGLAGPQVGINKRIIVIDIMEEGPGQLALINPKVIQKKGKNSFCEGCLSIPGITSDVLRPEWVQVEALNLKGESVKIDADGLLARVLQHEIDHLDGILFIDRLGFLKRKRVFKELGKKVCMEL